MNKIILVGRMIKDPELIAAEDYEKMRTKFIIAVDRSFKSSDGLRHSDLIPVIAWGKKAEVICKYMRKGSQISISGRLSTSSYEDKDGVKRFRAEVVVEDFKFVGNRKDETENIQIDEKIAE